MKKRLHIFTFGIFLGFLSLSPNGVFAQSNGSTGAGSSGSTTSVGGDVSVKLDNPLGNGIDNLPKLVEALLDIVLTVGVPLIALAIIYSGYLFVAAQGNPEALKKAKSTLVYVVIGAAILLAAYAISEAIVGSIEAIRGN
jgi:hypothetical protein